MDECHYNIEAKQNKVVSIFFPYMFILNDFFVPTAFAVVFNF